MSLTRFRSPINLSKFSLCSGSSPASITGFNNLEEKLSQHTWLKGRFIILPNVTTNGHKTLIRDGFTKHYKEMHCVGGYVDGSYTKSSDGNKNIFEGRQRGNGYKSIAVFQTSDNRKRNHSDLGKHVTYVKWSEPTAEAIRQACLAKESRLSHVDPSLPSVWVAFTVLCCVIFNEFLVDPMPPVMASPNFSEDKAAGD